MRSNLVNGNLVKAIVDYPHPITKREVRQMLGLASYYRRYVPGFANLVAPLNDLTKKKAPLTNMDPGV